MKRTLVALSLTAFIHSTSNLSLAQARDPVAAEALFKAGRSAAVAGNYDVACVKFEESQRLDPAPGTLLNLADCQEHRGKIATASQLYQEALQSLPVNDDRVSFAKQRVAALLSRVPELMLKLAEGAPPGTKVRRDDVELGAGSLGISLPADPGKHTVVVSAPGHASETFTFELAEGERKVLEVQPGPANAEAVTGSGGSTSSSGSAKTTAYVLGAVGVTGLVVGGLTGVMTLGKKSTADENCPIKNCNQVGYDAARSGKTLGVVSGVSAAVGVLALGAGAYFLLSGGDAKGAETAFAASAGPSGGEIAVVRRW